MRWRQYGFRGVIERAFLELSRRIYWQPVRKSFSQCREDMIIDKILRQKKRGFYVDVGANDPVRFSNTNRFYLRGWRGINIEPGVSNYQRFLSARKRDININCGVAVIEGQIDYYQFEPSTLSTFSSLEAEGYQQQGFRLVEVKKVKVAPLSKILKKEGVKRIDFLSVDTEGFDLEVLKSNDWKKYRPRLICVEVATHENTNSARVIDDYLSSVGYKLKAQTALNSIYETCQ